MDCIDYKDENMVRRILEKAQKEMRILRKSQRNQAMRLYRARKKVRSPVALISHVKQRKLICEKVSEILGSVKIMLYNEVIESNV